MKAICAILAICCSIAASAQVKIGVPEPSYRSDDKIDVEILNTGSWDVTFCVEYGYMSFIDSDHPEATPTPVYVQQKGAKGWNTLQTGPDIGSAVLPVTLGHGQSQHYPFRINAHGTVRLVLDNGIGSSDALHGPRLSCSSRSSLCLAKPNDRIKFSHQGLHWISEDERTVRRRA